MYKLIFSLIFLIFVREINAECVYTTNITANKWYEANGTENYIILSWQNVQSAISYKLDYSVDGLNWIDLYIGLETEYNHNCGYNPNKAFYYRVSCSIDGINFCDPILCNQFPVYTSCQTAEVGLSNIKSNSIDIEIKPEIPVANPDYTLYSIYCNNLGKFLQSSGSLSANEIYLTRAQWGKVTLKNLNPLSTFCFSVRAKNMDGMVRYNYYEQIIIPTQTFEDGVNVSNYDCPSYTDHSKWNICNNCSSTTWTYENQGGCNGGNIRFDSTGSCFVNSPYFDADNFIEIILDYDIVNSNSANYPDDALLLMLRNDSNYFARSFVKYFDKKRECEKSQVKFDISKAPATFKDKYNIIISSNPSYNSYGYVAVLDNIMLRGLKINTKCVTTREECIKPSISIENSNYRLCTGDSFKINPQITGTDTLFYKWFKNEKELTSEIKNSFEIKSDRNSSGDYFCIVNNFCGSATSDIITLKVDTILKISINPINPQVCKGDNINLSSISLSGEAIDYQWKLNDKTISNNSSITIVNADKKDEGIYDLKASNKCNADSSRSVMIIKQPASISISPVVISRIEGDSILFSLTPSGNPPFSFQWYKNENLINNESNNTLKIKNISSEDEGSYSCIIKNDCGEINVIVAILKVIKKTYNLTGMILYDNNDSNMNVDCKIFLLNKEMKIDSVNTDWNGNYIFTGIKQGQYNIRIANNNEHYGLSPLDALLVNRYFVKTYNIGNSLRKQAADVNNDGKINSIDALLITRRYVKIIDKFDIPDWLQEEIQIFIDVDIELNIRTICAGDVNGKI